MILRRQSGDLNWREALKVQPKTPQQADQTSAAKEDGGEAQAGKPVMEVFALGAPYPNPTSGQVTLPLSLPEAAEVHVEVYDVLGRLAKSTRRHFAAGRPQLRLDAGGLSSGVYFVRVRVVEAASGETHVFTEKFTLVK